MALDELLELVDILRRRIGGNRDLLSENEIRTRYALIDPLLRALGWDVEDPGQVINVTLTLALSLRERGLPPSGGYGLMPSHTPLPT